MNFTVLWLFAKVFSTKFGDVATFGAAQVSNPHKFFFHEIVIFTDSRKVFSLKSFLLYSTAQMKEALTAYLTLCLSMLTVCTYSVHVCFQTCMNENT